MSSAQDSSLLRIGFFTIEDQFQTRCKNDSDYATSVNNAGLIQCSNCTADMESLAKLCTTAGSPLPNADHGHHATGLFIFRPPPVPQALTTHSSIANVLSQMRAEYSEWLGQQTLLLREIIAADKQEEEEDCCPLCLLPMTEGCRHNLSTNGLASSGSADFVVTTACQHRFHLGCLRKSRQLSSPSCPMCRTTLAPGLTPVGRAKWAHSLSSIHGNTRFSFRSRPRQSDTRNG